MPALLESPARHVAEQQFHDRQAEDRAVTFAAGRADLKFDDDDYLDHETWIRPAFDRLGDVRGKAVLDFGCGHGMAAVVLARRGADVTAFDLSPGYVAEAAARADANRVDVKCVVADGESLPFADHSFDAVWGNAVLHHLDADRAGRELRRILRPGGVAVFCEPWGGNPVLRFVRERLPYPGKHRTADERPLLPADLPALQRQFPGMSVAPFQLLGMVRRVTGPTWLTRRLDAADRRLFPLLPPTKMWCRYLVLTLPR